MSMFPVPTQRDLKFMRWALAGAGIFSTCSRRQYMAVVLAPNGRFLGAGYNGSPPGIAHCTDGGCPRAQSSVAPGSSYDSGAGLCVAIHAEENALMWSDRSMREGGTIVVNGTPCWQCAKSIAGSGIKRVVYIADPAYVEWERCEQLLESAGVTCVGLEAGDL